VFDLIDENTIPVIVAAALIIILVVLVLFLRRRAAKKKSRVPKSATQAPPEPQVDLLQLERDLPLAEPQDFGLSLVLSKDQVFQLELPATIGRSEENHIVIEDESVSAHHARIYYDERLGAVCIEDLDSLNGVFIDGRPTVKNILNDGDQLTFGSFSLTFRDTGYLPPPKTSGDITHG
jgi:pSer/pThr/pTyr-binding forkhead associated (FHA) protein